MPFSPYFPHVLYSVALTSISINLVGFKKHAEDDTSRINAKISILDSIKRQLQSNEPLSTDELERLKKLARLSPADAASPAEQDQVSWSDVFSGKGPVGKDLELSKWDQKDLETSAFSCYCFA